MQHGMVIAVIIALSVGTTLGDYFLKKASQQEAPFLSLCFILGTATYALTAFGWVWVMPQIKLASLAALFSIFTTLLLVGLSTVIFRETLTISEVIGVLLAVASLAFLSHHQ